MFTGWVQFVRIAVSARAQRSYSRPCVLNPQHVVARAVPSVSVGIVR